MREVLFELTARGLPVTGTVVTSDEMDQLLDASDGRDIEIDTQAQSRRGPIRRFLGLPKRVKLPMFRLAKLPQNFSGGELKTLGITAAIHNSLLMTAQHLAEKLDAGAPLFLTSYFYGYLSNLKAILAGKGIGKTLSIHLEAEPGQQLKVEANPYYVLLTNLVEEAVVNSGLAVAIDKELDVTKVGLASLVMGVGKTPVEQKAATMELERLAAENTGESAKDSGLENKRLVLQNLFFNGVVPILKLAMLLSPEGTVRNACLGAACAVMGAVASVSVVEEVRNRRETRRLLQSAAGNEDHCSRLLIRLGSLANEKPLKETVSFETAKAA